MDGQCRHCCAVMLLCCYAVVLLCCCVYVEQSRVVVGDTIFNLDLDLEPQAWVLFCMPLMHALDAYMHVC